jgi:hypothetical protein
VPQGSSGIHFPAVDAGHVTSLCDGRVRPHLSWTTKREAVTCPRCAAILREADEDGYGADVSRGEAHLGRRAEGAA